MPALSYSSKGVLYPQYLTVCGQINHQKLLDCIEPLEQRNLDSIPRDFMPPFRDRVPPSTEPKKERIVCPSDDDLLICFPGMVEMSWLGPPVVDIQTTQALTVLFDYLTESPDAPLRKDFVQMKDPFCSWVTIELKKQTDCEIIASFSGVPVHKLDQIWDRFFNKTVADHQEPAAFDVVRMDVILEKLILGRRGHS